jgi:hypothetical protein
LSHSQVLFLSQQGRWQNTRAKKKHTAEGSQRYVYIVEVVERTPTNYEVSPRAAGCTKEVVRRAFWEWRDAK